MSLAAMATENHCASLRNLKKSIYPPEQRPQRAPPEAVRRHVGPSPHWDKEPTGCVSAL
jgi:hypothetical protein